MSKDRSIIREKGLEPSHPRVPEPKSGASTNSATRARTWTFANVNHPTCQADSKGILFVVAFQQPSSLNLPPTLALTDKTGFLMVHRQGSQ